MNERNLYNEILLLNDQSTTCPYFGSRTYWVDFFDWDEDFQIHFCLAHPFKHYFLASDDDDFEEFS